MRQLALLASVLLLGGSALAFQGRNGKPAVTTTESGSTKGDCVSYDFTDATITYTSATQACTVAAGSTVVHKEDGSTGEAADFRNSANGGVELGGTLLQVPQGTGPTSTDCDASGEAGRVYVDTDGPPGARQYICPGATGWEPQGGRYDLLGGAGADGAFSFDGTCSSDGAGGSSCCEGGTTSGAAPTKTCTLTANSALLRSSIPEAATTTLWSCEYEYTTFSLTGGTLTCGQAAAYSNTGSPTHGAVLMIRTQASPTITAGTIDMIGKGTAGGTAGSSGTAGNRTGGNGGYNSFFGANNGGAAGNNAGTAGLTIPSIRVGPMMFLLPVGTGGGGGAGSGSNAGNAAGVSFAQTMPTQIFGGLGGGGGGCSSSVASGAGDTGGRGGGGIIFETASTWATSGGVVFNVSGSNGAATGKSGTGGGGGGGILIYARDVGTDSATYTTSGGTKGARSDATNCALGADGSAGFKTALRAPY